MMARSNVDNWLSGGDEKIESSTVPRGPMLQF